MTLEEFIIKDGDVFMVEMRFGDKWPRDQLEGITPSPMLDNWRECLEVGDRVDIYDNNEWKIGIIQRVVKSDQLMVHLLNEHWKNDVMVKKDSGNTIE